MRRIALALALTVTLGLVACSGETGREFARYYDPDGLFATNVPAANDLTVSPPQSPAEGPTVLAGVVASPPLPSPSPQTGFSGFDITATETPDQTIYQTLVVTTDTFENLDQMTLYFLTADPLIDVQLDEQVRIDGHEGRLLVADVNQQGTITASLAAAVTLGREGTGYLLVALFPPGSWPGERGDFFRVLDSFRTDVPPGLDTFPIAVPPA